MKAWPARDVGSMLLVRVISGELKLEAYMSVDT
jgi:hypothetical protein